MDSKKIVQISLIAVFVALLGIAAYFFISSGFGKGEARGFVSAGGRIEGEEYNAASRSGGKVDKIYVEEGDSVKKGQVTATLSSQQLKAQLDSALSEEDLAENRLSQARIALSEAMERTQATVSQATANLRVNHSQFSKARVSHDQTLAHIKISEAQVEQSRLEYEQSLANLRKAGANLRYNEKEYARFKNLVEEDAVPRSKFDAIETQYLTAKAEYALARKEVEKARVARERSRRDLEATLGNTAIAKAGIVEARSVVQAGEANLATARAGLYEVRQREEEVRNAQALLNKAKAQVASARADLEDAAIRAPRAGRVVGKIVQVGEVIGAGTPIVTIVDMDDLFLRVFLPTKTAGRVKVGQEAKIYPDAYPEEGFDARVSKVSDRAEFTPKNVETKEQRSKLVFEVRLKIAKNKDYKLKPGMTSDALIRIADDASWDKAKPR